MCLNTGLKRVKMGRTQVNPRLDESLHGLGWTQEGIDPPNPGCIHPSKLVGRGEPNSSRSTRLLRQLPLGGTGQSEGGPPRRSEGAARRQSQRAAAEVEPRSTAQDGGGRVGASAVASAGRHQRGRRCRSSRGRRGRESIERRPAWAETEPGVGEPRPMWAEALWTR